MALKSSGASEGLWSCPAAIPSPVGNAVQSAQQIGTNTDSALSRYWLWRFDRTDDPVPPSDFWGKTLTQAVTDLMSITNNPTLGIINGTFDIELCVDSYFPNTVPSADANLKGRTIHPGGATVYPRRPRSIPERRPHANELSS